MAHLGALDYRGGLHWNIFGDSSPLIALQSIV
jgi:hypothetical protein